MKDFNEIAVFARVAQMLSFSKAATSLGMPVSTVSRKVSDLEARLGVTLVQRTTRKLNLTRMGAQYLDQCADLLQGFEDAEARLTEYNGLPEGSLRVSIPNGMADSSFIELVAKMLRDFPGLEIELVVSNAFVDLVAENIDVAIRFGELSDSGLIAKKLGYSSHQLVASPRYLKAHGEPKRPTDLKGHECIIYRAKNSLSRWSLNKDKSRQVISVKGRFTASDMSACRRLAIHGHGIAHLPEMYAFEDIKTGRLKRVLPDWTSPVSPVHAVYPNRRYSPQRLTAFLKYLSEWESSVWTKL